MFYRAATPALFALEPEQAHGLSILALKSGLPICPAPRPDPRLRSMVAGIAFANPIGMAAGYDKDAEVPDALLNLGFGAVEVGTVTPLPQPGNPRPRIFRLKDEQAVINRFGFNSKGHDFAFGRLSARGGRQGVVGVNIGANKESSDRIGDYEAGIRRFAPFASYITVNISSPNTAGLRDLQSRASLAELLDRILAARASTTKPQIPIFLKIAPDLHDGDLADIAEECVARRIDGIIVSNTTLSRHGVASPFAKEAGGVSGKPLFQRSTVILARMRRLVGPEMALIGVGGVDSAGAAIEKVRAGADLVQLYTGMIYRGPGLAGAILKGLSRFMDAQGLISLAALRDSATADWAARSPD
jgi:dihydroorotate dehydrogenase